MRTNITIEHLQNGYLLRHTPENPLPLGVERPRYCPDLEKLEAEAGDYISACMAAEKNGKERAEAWEERRIRLLTGGIA